MSLLNFTYNTNTGFTHETEFTFIKEKKNLPSYNVLAWDFGDGNTEYFNKNLASNVSSAADITTTHTYSYPGLYKVSLSAWSEIGGGFAYAENYIEVKTRYRDAILFTNTPNQWNVAGQKTVTPYVINLTSTRIDEPISVVLHATNSKSVPYYAVEDKWNFLVPTWKFIKASTGEIITDYLTLTTGPLYSNNTIVAVTAQESFYYIDYTPTITTTENCPVVITATLSTEHFVYPLEGVRFPYSSYSNNEDVKAAAVWHGINVSPTNFKLSENFLDEIYPVKWANTPIPVMITCQFQPSLNIDFNNTFGISSTDLLAYPNTNELGALNTITLKLSNVPDNLYKVSDSNLKFQKFDEKENLISGYIYTTITPLSPVEQTKIIATGNAANQLSSQEDFDFPFGYPIKDSAYISHPYANSINKIDVTFPNTNCKQYDYYNSLNLLAEGRVKSFFVPENRYTDKNNLSLSGGSGVFGLTYNPVKNLLYAANSDNSIIYVIENETVIKTLALSSIVRNPETDPISPSYISIDKNHNVWISLYDSSLLLKFDTLLNNLLLSALPPLLSARDVFDLPYFTPPIVETDLNSNVWSCFSHPQSSCLVKYNGNTGEQIFIKNLGIDTVPVSLTLNKKNDVWVACREANSLFCFNTNGTQISAFDVLKPSFITTDKNNNLWILHGYNLISFFDTKTIQMSSWKFQNYPTVKYEFIRDRYITFAEYSESEKINAFTNDEIWGGLSVDVFNRVWFINSEKNFAGCFPSNDPNNLRIITMTPTASSNYFVGGISSYIENIETDTIRSAQAFGDWTGNKWYQKYGSQYFSVSLSGSSNTFSVLSLEKPNDYNNLKGIDFSKIAKINEDFNCSEYFRSLALPELLGQNKSLFEEFLPSLVGSGRVDVQEIGRVMYEKIANFNRNHADIDEAEIEQLLSLSVQLNQKIKTYGIDFPSEIKRLINLFSVSLHYLRGVSELDSSVESNIGPILTETSYVSAGQYIYARDKRYRTIQLLLIASDEQGRSVYPLSSINVNGLRGDITTLSSAVPDTNFTNYYFFEQKAQEFKNYTSNLIDWTSPYTTLQYQTSSAQEFYQKNGIVDLYFNNLLTKQLFHK